MTTRFALAAAMLLFPSLSPAQAETLVASRTIPAGTVLTSADVVRTSGEGVLKDPAQVVGLEARVALYKGRPLLPAHLGPVTVVERNQIVVLAYQRGALSILVEGRALGRGGVGDRIKVLNAASRATVSGTVRADGSIVVLTAD